MWALHDPYAVLGEDKPFKSGKTQFRLRLPGVRRCRPDSQVFSGVIQTLRCCSPVAHIADRLLSPPQENATEFLRVWTTVERGRESEHLLFRTSGAGSEEPVRTSLMCCHMMITLLVNQLIFVCLLQLILLSRS